MGSVRSRRPRLWWALASLSDRFASGHWGMKGGSRQPPAVSDMKPYDGRPSLKSQQEHSVLREPRDP